MKEDIKPVGEWMRALGFNADAGEGAQKAFIKNLIRAAQVADARSVRSTPCVEKENPTAPPTTNKVVSPEEQLEFCFDIPKEKAG